MGNDNGFEAGVKQSPGLWKSTARDAKYSAPFQSFSLRKMSLDLARPVAHHL